MSDWMKAAERGLLAAERALLCALLVVLVGLSFLQVILRGGFSAGLLWADVFLRHLVLLIGFLGAAVAVSEGKMFSFDAAAHLLKGRVKTFAALLAQAFAAAMAAALAAAAWTFFLNEYRLGGTLFTVGRLSVPSWVSAVVVPFGFALVFVHCVLRAAAALGRPSPEGDGILPSPKGAGTPEK
ncbi:MAG: TRAP transporter small permease [Elusimicrobia bacterium]|nr:TRAP transporter small permease [Elusimicrobiota bacterium]